MNPRCALLAGCVLSFVALPGLSRDAHAIPIDNDVSIEWQQTTFSDFFPSVVNGNFVIDDVSDLSTVAILIAITESQYLGGFTLWLDVVNPITSTPGDYTPILAGGSPLRLTFAAGFDNNGNANGVGDVIFGSPNPAADMDLGGDPNISKNLNRLLLLSNLQNSLQTFTPDPVDPNLGGTWSTVRRGDDRRADLAAREWSARIFDQRHLHRKPTLACRSGLSAGGSDRSGVVPTVFIGWRFSLDNRKRRRPVPARKWCRNQHRSRSCCSARGRVRSDAGAVANRTPCRQSPDWMKLAQ